MANTIPGTSVGETDAGEESIPKLPAHLRVLLPLDIESARQRDAAIRQFCSEFLREGEDFQKLEFHDKPVLSKSGAEKLVIFCGLEPRITAKDETLDWTGKDHGGEPFFYALYRYTMFVGGKVAGEGEGSANSWEEKHRYRWVLENRLPAGVDKSTLLTRGGTIFEYDFAIEKAETSGRFGKPIEYWQRFRDARKNGTARIVVKKTRQGAEETGLEIDSTVFRVPNESAPDVVNTTQKMAQKRAYICATIMATGVSGKFTQDIDDMPPEMFEGRQKRTDPSKEEKRAPQRERPRDRQPEPKPAPVSAQQQPATAGATNAPTPEERLAKMRKAFAELRNQCPGPWFRRQLDYAEVDSLTVEQGLPLFVAMRDFANAVKAIDDLKVKMDPDIFKRALFEVGVSDIWELKTLKDLYEFASTLQQGVTA